ncbi:MAG: radical SAM protein [Lentisphaerae bacterium]|nr:radical SAM protein [Lentisphaerota bacterium]
MNILFLNPPFKPEYGKFSREQRSPAITKSGTFYYPMWLCYAAGYLEQEGYNIKIIDAPAMRLSYQHIEKEIIKFKPSLIVLDTSTPSIDNDIRVGAKLKAATEAFVLLVGTHPTALPEGTLNMDQAIDAVARREYEETVLALAKVIKHIQTTKLSTKILSKIPGLSYRTDSGVVNNIDREPIKNLDKLPFLSKVFKKHLNLRQYFYTIAKYPQVAIYSGRGCPYGCVYCVYPQVMHGHNYRKRSVENLVNEFKYIEEEMPEVKEVFIEDDTFTVDAKRVAKFSQLYKKAGLKISWIANSRADISFATLNNLKKCNCRLLCVGFESGNQKLLDKMNKNLKLEKATQFVKDAKAAGILVHGCFMVGTNGETSETLKDTLKYAIKLNPDTAQFFPLMVYPGTTAYNWAIENNYLISRNFKDWNTTEGNHNCLISRPGLINEELLDFCDRARKEFYLRPSYITYRLMRLIKHPVEDGPRMFISMKRFWKFIFNGTDKSTGWNGNSCKGGVFHDL